MFNDLNISMENGYILTKPVVDETIFGIHIPNDEHNRFSRVLKTCENSVLNVGDIIIHPIGRSTPVKINGEIYHTMREGFVFAKIVEDGK